MVIKPNLADPFLPVGLFRRGRVCGHSLVASSRVPRGIRGCGFGTLHSWLKFLPGPCSKASSLGQDGLPFPIHPSHIVMPSLIHFIGIPSARAAISGLTFLTERSAARVATAKRQSFQAWPIIVFGSAMARSTAIRRSSGSRVVNIVKSASGLLI